MPRANIVVSVDVRKSVRTAQLEGLFDIPPSEKLTKTITANLPIEDKSWNIGAIIGPSGSGKSTILKNLFSEYLTADFKWNDRSVVDNFSETMSIKEIVELLSSVGFSSPPSWLKPYDVLSNGEKFRVTIARMLAEQRNSIVAIDEFTSVVDRTVARIASAAIARTVRKRKQQIIVATCHDDIEEWLQPDWVFRTADERFEWRSLQRRPTIELEIYRVNSSAWNIFRQHHYLSTNLNTSAVCFLATWNDRPVAFSAWLALISARTKGKRGHRTVTLPDYQGVGIGNAVSETTASIWRSLGFRAYSTTSHPSMMAHRSKSPLWRMHRSPNLGKRGGWKQDKSTNKTIAVSRLTAGFEYVGPSFDPAQSKQLLGY